jgi:hypothetical protein
MSRLSLMFVGVCFDAAVGRAGPLVQEGTPAEGRPALSVG